MSRIRCKNTKPEIKVRKYLHSQGFRYRIHDSRLPGKPDIVLPKYKVVIFINGCFWHGHRNCKYFKLPSTNAAWWESKINRTINNDKSNQSALINMGWKVLSIYECSLKRDKLSDTMEIILSELH